MPSARVAHFAAVPENDGLKCTRGHKRELIRGVDKRGK